MIERQDHDGIRVLRLAHGKVSAIDIELGEAFIVELKAAADDPVRGVVVTGTGSSFSAGVDLFRLIKDNGIMPDQIGEIEIHMPTRGVKRVPTTRHASISALKVSAIAAATGKLDFYYLHGPQVAVDAAIASMIERVKFVGRDDWTGMEHGRHAIVIIHTRDGRKFEEETWFSHMNRSELSAKFNELVLPQFGAARTDLLQKSLLEIESVRNIKTVMQQLRV